jgi:hypothetical protein
VAHTRSLHMKRTFAIAAMSAALSAAILGTVPAAFAQEATQPTPVAEPVVPSQTSPDAVAEGAISKTYVNPATRLADIKSKGAADIAKRISTLSALTAKLSAQTTDCGSNAAMSAEISNTVAGLNTVGQNLAITTDIAQAKVLHRSIFIDYRVYLVVAPKAGKVLRCDNQLERNQALTNEGAKLQQSIDAAKARGVDTTSVQACTERCDGSGAGQGRQGCAGCKCGSTEGF